MTGSRFHAFGTLLLSLVVFGLSIGAAVLGAHKGALYADAGQAEATTSAGSPSGR